MIVEQKRKRGRPKKNKELNLYEIDSDKNVNINNLYPPNLIVLNKIATKILDIDADYTVHMECNKPKVFEILLDGFKGKNKHINLVFTKSGLIFNQGNFSIQKDMVKFECKIFPDKLISYSINDRDEVVQVEIDSLFKIFKTIPKDHIFSFSIHKIEQRKIFRIVNIDPDPVRNKFSDHRVCLNDIIGYCPIRLKRDTEGNLPQYDAIVMFEADDFQKMCKNIGLFTNIFTITCTKITNENGIDHCVIFEYNKPPMNASIVHTQCKKFIFLKYPETDIKNEYNMESFIKYIKSAKFSTIIKLYLSRTEPLIIEYSVEPGLGTFQIFVQPQNKIKNM
jgi:hypothetical protein